VRLLNPRPFRCALAATAVGLLCAASAAVAQPDTRNLATTDHAVRLQPPWTRLEAMGGLVLSVRDEYTELNLWDFAGIPIGLVEDQDSTSLDLWLDRDGATLDHTVEGVDREVDRYRSLDVAGQSIMRFGRSAIGLGAGTLGLTGGMPFADQEHTTEQVGQPVLQPVATGHLWKGIRWGLGALFGSETLKETWMRDQVVDGRVELTDQGEQLPPPDLFSPDRIEVGLSGYGAALGYDFQRWVNAGVYYGQRREAVEWHQEGTRSVYDLNEVRHWTEFGLGAIVKPYRRVDVGIAVGREYWADPQTYRFSLSGGSNADPTTVRGNRRESDVRHDFVQIRAQGDVPNAPVTLGASYRVAYDRAIQNPVVASPDDFNNYVLDRAAEDTLAAPQLVESLRSDTRLLSWGVGGSYRLRQERAVAGLEYEWTRAATDGTERLARAVTWQVRAGGQYEVSPGWAALAGYRHTRSDEDTYTERNEMVADRFSVGVMTHRLLTNWQLTGELYREWQRTEYPDPGELGGEATGFGLQLGRSF
jgi:hypothetical protein